MRGKVNLNEMRKEGGMKKWLLFVLLALFILPLTVSVDQISNLDIISHVWADDENDDSSASCDIVGPVIYACYQKNHGQLRLVDDLSSCLSSECPVYWSKDGFVPAYHNDIFVNDTGGQDVEGYGLSALNPFKTISYAVEQVPYLRKSPDFRTTIHVAEGNYAENVNIAIDNLRLLAEPVGATVVIDPLDDGQSAVVITAATGIVVEGMVIDGGKRGLYCLRNSSCELINSEVKGTQERGIQVDENSTLSLINSIVEDCGIGGRGDGLAVFRSSSATVSGETAFINNTRRGVAIGLNSSLIFNSTTATISGNGERGIEISGASDAITLSSDITTGNNGRDGVFVYGGSRFSIYSGSKVSALDNSERGVGVIGSSHMSIAQGCNLITTGNTKAGLVVSQNASLELQGSLLCQDNQRDGMIVVTSSGVWMDGIVDILGNKDFGLVIGRASSVQASENSVLTVSGTIPGDQGYSTGINIGENSTLRSSGEVTVSENRGGFESYGILVVRSSNVTFRTDASSGVKVLIQENDDDGIEITQASSGRFSKGVTIQLNGRNGLAVNNNSEFFGQEMTITSNATQDVNADIGGNAICSGCDLGDVNLSFGSRGSFHNGTIIAALTCDPTALYRDDTVSGFCP